MVGLVLVLSVAVSGVVTSFSKDLLDLVGLDETLSPLVKGLSILLGLAASAVLFFTIFRLLAAPHDPARSLWSGALFGAVGFELLKQLSRVLLASTKDQPAFQAFGIALILLVWINYFSRVLLYAAAFAHTSRASRTRREAEAEAPAGDTAVSAPGSVLAAAVAAPSAGAPREPTSPGSWKEGFVDKIDSADPDDVGQASAAAARLAHEQQQVGVRQRLLALGAAGSAAGLAAIAVVRRRHR